MTEEYRQELIKALAGLRNLHSDILGFVINVAMQGEFKEWNEATALDTEIVLDIEFFKDKSEDKNVLYLVELAKKTEEIYARIADENDISEHEEEY